MKNINRFFAIVLFIVFSVSAWGEGTETFEGLSNATNYADRSWTGTNGQTWSATSARTDQKISGNRGITSSASGATITMVLTNAQKAAGIGTLSFDYKHPYSDSGKSNTVTISVNGDNYSTSSLSYSSSSRSTSITVNAIPSTNSLTITISGNARLCVDNFSWTSCSSCSSCSNTPTMSFTNTTVNKTTDDNSYTQTVNISGKGSGQTVSYSSSDESIGTVNSSGVVTLKNKVGSTTITASVEASGTYCSASASYTINVTQAPIDITLHYKGTTATLDDQTNPYTLPTTGTYVEDACDEWKFAGWYGSTYGVPTASETKPTYITQMTATGHAYAVYQHTEGGSSSSNATFNATAQGYSNGSDAGSKEVSGVTFAFDGGLNTSNSPKFYTSSNCVHLYPKNTLTISASENITSIVFSLVRNDGWSANTGTWNNGTTTWTGEASSVVFTVNNTSGYQERISSITVTVGGGGTTTYSTDTDCRNCTIPTLTFGASSVDKYDGDAPFILTATPANNPLGGTITYSSSLTAKAEVNENTGEVTIHEAMSNTPVIITATLSAVDNGGENCQKRVTASYTLNIYNKVTWKVSGSDYTTGHPTVRTTEGGEIETMPTNPDEDACGGKIFVGWTDAPYEENDAAPTHLYKALSEFPHITDNATFHAIFAESSGDSHKFARLNDDEDFVRAIGTKIAIVSNAQNKILQNDFTSVTAPTPDGEGLITVTDNQIWTLTGQDTYGYWILKSGDVQLGVNTDEGYDSGYEQCGNYSTDASSWSVLHASDISGTSNCFYFYNWYESSPVLYDLLEFYGGSTNKWESVYFSGINTNFKNYGAMRVYGPAVTYTKYATACCDEVETPVVNVVARSTKATLSWQSQVGATNGYSVVVKQGESVIYQNTTIAAGATSCEATGLTANTSYTYTVTAKGATCNRSTSGNFTTTNCEDVPYDIVITPSLKSIKVRWTAEAATATINLYSDEECSTAPVKSMSGVTSPATIEDLAENTTYYVKVLAGGTCASLPVEVITLSTDIVIAEWFPDGIKINLTADDASASVIIENKDNTGSTTTSYADSLFFSKYFEAAASTKLLAVFNGTDHPIDLSDYKLAIAQATSVFTLYRFSDMVYDKAGVETHFTDQQLFLPPGKEIILISYPSSTADLAIIDCAQNNDNSGFDTYYRMTTPYLQFNGDDAVGLVNPQGNLIDLIGAGSLSGGSDVSAVDATSQSGASGGAYNGFMDKPGGWYTTKGYHAEDNNTETNNYALSTNRCLLIRRNHVKSGLNAVARNSEDFVTLGDYTFLGDDYEGEWKGVQIPGAGCNDGNCAGITASCDGFDKVGSYDYNTYYATFDSIAELKELGGKQNDDGTYTIPIDDLDELSCTMLRVKVYDGETEKALRDYKVPIMVEGSKMTDNAIFNKHEIPTCKECDVVILRNATLEKTNGANDRNEVRNLMIYPGGTLIVPSGKGDYTVQSIQFRVEKEDAPVAKLNGNLITKDEQVIVSRRIKNDRYYFFSLPYDCNIADIHWSSGLPATQGVDYQIVEYDGERRALEGSTQGAQGHWKVVSGTQLKAGVGYNIAVSSQYLKELIFPMAIGGRNLTTIENTKTSKTVEIKQYTGSTTINNHNWNLVAHPYVSAFSPYSGDKITAGWLKYTPSGDPETPGEWTRESTGSVYLTMPSFNSGSITYTQTLSTTITSLNPFLAVFVQGAGEGTLTFEQSARKLSAPARHLAAEAENEDESIFAGVTLSGNGESDQTNLRIRPDFTDEYQLGYDLEKFITFYTPRPQVYMKTPSNRLAFQAVSDEVAKNTFLPMGVYCYQASTYTFALYDRYPIDELEAVYLFDKQTGVTTNLLYDTYSFTTTGQIYTNTRFSLNVIVKRRIPQTATDMDTTPAPDAVVRKILINGHVYIQRGGALYDITGKQLLNH